jgi:anti-sigma regulatory factor (Ser/Thr protein kinase)
MVLSRRKDAIVVAAFATRRAGSVELNRRTVFGLSDDLHGEARGSAAAPRRKDVHVADEDELEVELPRDETAPAIARLTVRRAYAERLDSGVLGDAELLVSELTSNALRHGRGEITLRARLDEDRLLVEVIDEGSGFERALRRSDFEEVGGWGLEIVEDVASRWGVHEGTTHVWFELERPGPRLGQPDGTA